MVDTPLGAQFNVVRKDLVSSQKRRQGITTESMMIHPKLAILF